MLLKARWVVPVSSPPIENGAIVIEGDRIVFVGAVSDLSRKPDLDLGDSTLLPGLINTHCHLEHSTRITPQPPLTLRGGGFTKWVREMSQVGIGLETSAAVGIDRLLRTGTTTVADHCNPDTPRFDTPFRRIIFWEVLGAAKDRAEASLKRAIKRTKEEGGFITPHSFYGVHRKVIEEIRDHNTPQPPLTLPTRVLKEKLSKTLWYQGNFESSSINVPQVRGGQDAPPLKVRGGWEGLWSLHLLESSDEDQYLRTGNGPLADYIRERGGEVSPPEPPLSRIPPHTILVHGNYLTADEIGALRDLNASVIHCPGSHRFFGHKKFPLEELRQNGIPIALGTDSLASNEEISMLREMRLLKESYPELTKKEILEMATINGARALGMDNEIGSIEIGKKADLIAVPGSDILEAKEVCFSMLGGKIITPPSLPSTK